MSGLTGLSGISGLSGLTGLSYDLFVDSVNGSDANDGRTAAGALQTIAALEAAGISAGDRIGLARGSHWREQLDITVNNVTVGAYGGGTGRPILDASDVVPAGDWAATGGTANVYQASVSLAVSATKQFVNAWEDDAFLARAANVAACDAAPGSYYPSAETGNITLYIHPNGSTNPTSDGKTYEVSVRQFGLEASGATGTQVVGIQTRRNLYEDGSLRSGRSSLVDDCQISDGSKHNALLYDGSTIQNSTLDNAYYTASFTLLVWNEDTPAGLGITAKGCTFSMDAYDTNAGGAFCHNNVGGSFGTLTIQGCTFTNLNLPISQSAVDAVTASGNTATGCGSFYRVNTAITHELSDNTVINTVASNDAVQTNVVGATINITGDTYTLDDSASGIRVLSNNTTLRLTNSTVTLTSATAADGCVLLNVGLSGLALVMNGSSLVTDGGNCIRGLTIPTYIGDNNNYNKLGGFNVRWGGTTYVLIANFQAATGQDAHSTVG